jgi:hypothetical protein
MTAGPEISRVESAILLFKRLKIPENNAQSQPVYFASTHNALSRVRAAWRAIDDFSPWLA